MTINFETQVCKFFVFGYLCVLNFEKGLAWANLRDWVPIPKHRFVNEDLVAQLVEHYTFNVRVLGSNPSGITIR